MKPVAFIIARHALEMTQEQLGHFLGYKGGVMISHFERGNCRIPKWVELSMNVEIDKRIAELGK